MSMNPPDFKIDVHIPSHVTCEAVLMQASCHKEWKRANQVHRKNIALSCVRHLCSVSVFGWKELPYDDLTRLLPEGCEEYQLIKRAVNLTIISRIKL